MSALAEVIAQGSGLSHGYWIVLTIFIVLRPDYSSTLYRGLQRAAGTVVGAGLGVATVLLVKVSLTALLCGIAVSLVIAYAVFTVSYLVFAVFLTDFLVVLLALLGLPPDPTAVARLIGTGIGTGLAIFAYLLWPTWEGTSAAEKFARLITAQGSYGRALLRAYTRPGGTEAARLGSLQLAARRARIDAEASADRLSGEPEHAPMSAGTARALASASHRIAQALLTLGAAVAAHHARRITTGDADLRPRLDELATGVVQATGQIAGALRAAGPGPIQADTAEEDTAHGDTGHTDTAHADAAHADAAHADTAHADTAHADTGDAGLADAGAGASPPQPPGGLPGLGSLPPLRAQQRAIWRRPPAQTPSTGETQPSRGRLAGQDAGPDDESAGLFAATDGLVDAINTAADVLRG